MRRWILLATLLVLVVADTFAQETAKSDPVLQLDVVRVEASEVSPILVTRLHERFPDGSFVTSSPNGTAPLDTLRIDRFLQQDPFEPVELPSVEEILAPPTQDGHTLKPNN